MIEGQGCGPVLLRIIIRESDMETNANEIYLRHKLSTLDLYIATIDHDINKFNIYVKQLTKELAANGKKTDDLLANLFKAYHCVPDKTFSRYVSSKEDSFDDGLDLTHDFLMKQC